VLWKVTRAAIDATSKVLHTQLRGEGDEGDDESAVPADDAVMLPTFGLAIRPVVTATLRAFVTRIGDEISALKLFDREKLPTDLAEGETRIYSVGLKTNRIELRMSGVIVVQGGAKPVAHEGSATSGHTHALSSATAGPYPVTGNTLSATDSIAAGQGSANFLVPDT
jgi:hypothetical protein